MRLISCCLTLLVASSVSFHPALAESDSQVCPPDSSAEFLACDQEKGKLLKTVSSLKEEKASLEDSVAELRTLLATQGQEVENGAAEVAKFKEQLKVRQDEALELNAQLKAVQDEALELNAQLKAVQDESLESKARADAAEGHAEKTKELHLGSQEQSDLLQAQITRLYDDLKARQENLEQATAAHDKLANELKSLRSEGDGSRRDLEAQLAAATKAASSEKMGLQEERDMLKAELEQLQASLRDAQVAYLPVWSHAYYDAARQAAEPALKYHREEILTGKAYTKARSAAEDAYTTAHAAAHPHMQKAWTIIEPTFTKVSQQVKVYWDQLQAELSKEPYSTYVAKARAGLQTVYNYSHKIRARAIDLWNSEEANKAKAFVLSQKQAFERDLGNMYTHALGADVPGSGIDPSFVQSLVQLTLYAVPILLIGVPLMCMRGGNKKASEGMPTASPASSKTTKRMRKK